MRIGIVSPFFYPCYGGITEHVFHQYRDFKALGHAVRIITPFSGEGGPSVGEDLIRIGRSFPFFSNGSVTRLSFTFGSRRIRTILAHEKFDILHFHQPLFCPLNLRILKTAHMLRVRGGKLKLVGTFHASGGRGAQALLRLSRKLFAPSMARLDARIAVSKSALEFHRTIFPGSYHVVPNGVDVERFAGETRTIPAFMDGRLNILFVGRPEPRKGVRHLLKSLELLPNFTSRECRLILVGDGPFRAYYQQLVSPAMRDRIVFVGKVPYADIPAHFRSAHLFCSPAGYGESFGIVLLEAMAAGLPIVAGDNDGYRQIIKSNVNGLLIDPNDPAAIAQGVAHLANSECERIRLSQQNQKDCAKFGWNRVFAKIENIYAGLISHE